ncbi:MAG: hypothetical protein NT142_16320 [Planctomycetota bacterium]|nr:hypothetical protein [Planctomycetota bacterium]
MARHWLLCGLIVSFGCHRPFLERKTHDDPSRVGHPDQIQNHALSQGDEDNVGLLIGGGAPKFFSPSIRKIEEPKDDEGTWGWDYAGRWFPSRVSLGWWHGRKFQSGEGAYKVDHLKKQRNQNE